ncbi:hypothetical protein B7463_g4440, partial [Scytalidium lignicola]
MSEYSPGYDDRIAGKIPTTELLTQLKSPTGICLSHSSLNQAITLVPLDLAESESQPYHSRRNSFTGHERANLLPSSGQPDSPEIESVRSGRFKIWRDQDEAVNPKYPKAPYEYMAGLPRKNFRSLLIMAFNEWFQISEEQCTIVSNIVGVLHNASLMIDDIQDGSKLRRGMPVTHSVYGIAQTINAANYMYFEAQHQLCSLPNWEKTVRVFEEELLYLHRGQGMELYWRDTFTPPTLDEYLQMVSNKTGGLFRLALRLLQTTSGKSDKRLEPLADIFGIIYQVLDDYKNLLDGKMATTKGYCDDISEGKFSFPIVHALSKAGPDCEIIKILKSRPQENHLKAYIVRYLENESRSFEYTRRFLKELQVYAKGQLANLGHQNSMLEKLLDILDEHMRAICYKPEDHAVGV